MIGTMSWHDLVRHTALMSRMVLAMDRLVVTVLKDGNEPLGGSLLELGFDGWPKWCRTIIQVLREHGTSTLSTMPTAASLLFGDASQMCRVLVAAVIMVVASSLRSLLCLSQVDAPLLGMMLLVWLSAVAAHMSRPFLALQSAVLALCDWPSLLGYENEFTV